MDIDLNLETISIPTKQVALAEIVRPLTPADIKLLAVKEGRPDDAPIGLVKRLSTRHHALARELAKGLTNWEAGLVAGYDENYVSILRADPTFANLIAFYVDKKTREAANLNDLNAGLAEAAMHELLDRFEDPEQRKKMTVSQVLAMAQFSGDRAGLAPQTNVNHKHEHTVRMADRMQRARERVDQSRVIDVTPEKSDAA